MRRLLWIYALRVSRRDGYTRSCVQVAKLYVAGRACGRGEGINAANRNETVYVIGPINQLLASAVRVLSPGLARKVMRSQAGR